MSGHGKGRHGGAGRPGDEALPGELTDFAADRLLDRFGPAGDLGIGRGGAEDYPDYRNFLDFQSEDYPDWEAVGGIGRPQEHGGWDAEPRDSLGTRLLRRAASDTGAGPGAADGRADAAGGLAGAAVNGRDRHLPGPAGADGLGCPSGLDDDAWWTEDGTYPAGWAGREAPGAARADKAWRSDAGARPGSGPRDDAPGSWRSEPGGRPADAAGPGGSRAAVHASGHVASGNVAAGHGFGDDDALTRLLCAAAAPARPHELRGYESVRRAYEQAGARTRGRHLASTPLARLAGVRLAALAGTLTVAGGAVAAEANALPAPIQRAAHTLLGPMGVPAPPPERDGDPTAAGGTGPDDQPQSGGPYPDGTATSPGTHGGPGTSASAGGTGVTATPAAVADLCRAYVAGNGQGNTLTSDQRKRLAALAGGENLIPSYCAQMLADAAPLPTASPTADPSPTSSDAPGSSAGQGTGSTAASTGKGHVTHTSPSPGKNGHTSANLNAATKSVH